MPKTSINSHIKESQLSFKCYNCHFEIHDSTQKYCQNCKVILKPNDLKWRNSFILCICLLCLIPFLIAIISALQSG